MISILFYRKFSNLISMKKTWKKPVTIRWIKNIDLVCPQLQICFESLKSKVQPNQKVMVAVSGGADSIVTACLMYNFFLKNKYSLQNLFFMHCNHNTRPGNSADEKFIKAFFEGTQLIIVKRTKSKKSSESELRKRRYGEFNTQSRKYRIDQIIFGHNLTDRIESTFLNLLRGASLNGFLAMQPQEMHHLLPKIQVLRPLLGLTKNEIFHICKQNKIPFVTDPTNQDSRTSLRNKLRNKVLPQLYALAHKQTTDTNSFIESMKNIYDALEKSHGKFFLNSEFWTLNSKFWILNSIKRSPHRHAKFAYQRMIDPQSITSEWVMQIMKTIESSNNITAPLLKERTMFLQKNESGYKYFNKIYLFKSHGKIYIISAPKFFRQKMIASAKKIAKVWNIAREGQEYEIHKDEYVWATLRFPRKWDRYKNKTWNEWCINQKIPIFQRNFIPIIVKGNQIIKIIRP